MLSWDGQTKRVEKRRVVLGRSRECDIQVEDANVSRRHAELRQEGASVLDRRPRLDERDRGERPAREAGEARAGRHLHGRRDRDRLHARSANDRSRSTTYETVLLILKIAFLVLLYLFIWRIVRTAGRDLRLPQESFILRPEALAGGAIGAGDPIRVASSSCRAGARGRRRVRPRLRRRSRSAAETQNDVSIDGDEFASARHVRVEPRRDGVWVQRPRLDERHAT